MRDPPGITSPKRKAGEREGTDVDLAREIDHETGLFGVAADPGVGRNRRVGARRAGGYLSGGRQHPGQQQAQYGPREACCALWHRISGPFGPLGPLILQ